MWSRFWNWLSPETKEVLKHVVGGSLIIAVVSLLALLLEALVWTAHHMGASGFAVGMFELLARAALIADALIGKYLAEGVWHAFRPSGQTIARVLRPWLKTAYAWFNKRRQ
jgi:hypothetical protein